MISIDKIYVIHYSKLTERKKNLLKQFEDNNITNYEFIDNYDRETITQDTLLKYSTEPHKLDYGIITACVAISHIETYKKIINNNYNLCLIFEDDIILCDNFMNKLNEYLESIPNDIDLGFLVDGCNLHANYWNHNIISSKIWYNVNYSRTTSAYLITKKACEKILTTIIPFTMPIDHQLNIEIKTNNLKTYWCEPTICSEGSTTIYKSSCR